MPCVVAISGASSGIGAALAKLLSTTPEEYKLTLIARRAEMLNEVVAACGGPEVAQAVVADASKRDQVKAAVKAAVARWGKIDVWVNNVGRSVIANVADLTDEDVNDAMQANVFAALYGMQEVLPHFKERKEGQILNISAYLGRDSTLFPPVCSYSAAKHFLNALTDALRVDLKEEFPGIAVTTFTPGLILNTEFGQNAKGELKIDPAKLAAMPVSGGQHPEEIAALLKFAIVDRQPEYYSRASYKKSIDAFIAEKASGTMDKIPE